MYMDTLIVALYSDTPSENVSKVEWLKHGVQSAFTLYAKWASDHVSAPSTVKRQDLKLFHYHAIKFFWYDLPRTPNFKKNSKIMADIVQLIWEDVTGRRALFSQESKVFKLVSKLRID